MPELPEVQTIVDDLNAAGLVGSTISTARVYWQRTIAAPSPQEFCRRVRKRRITSISRRGKFIVFNLNGNETVLLHLRMSGRLNLVSKNVKRSKHEHVTISFTDGLQLRFHDTRKFGRLYLAKDTAPILGRLGPEPLAQTFTAGHFTESLKARKRMMKPLLLDQHFIAGLGNIYVDEALWEAKIHPCRISATITTAEAGSLHRAIRRVLKRGLRNLGTSLGTGKTNFYSVAKHQGRNRDELRVFRRTGLPCPRCKTTVDRIIVGQRSTHICPKCQII